MFYAVILSEAKDPCIRFAHTLNAPTPETTMLTLLILAPIFLVLFLITRLLRLLFFPFHHHHHHGWRGYGNGRNQGWNRYDYNPYNRPRFGGLASILVLVALERLFDRRW